MIFVRYTIDYQSEYDDFPYTSWRTRNWTTIDYCAWRNGTRRLRRLPITWDVEAIPAIRFRSSFNCNSCWKLASFSCVSSRLPVSIDSVEYSTWTQGQIVGDDCSEPLLPGRDRRGESRLNSDTSFDLKRYFCHLPSGDTERKKGDERNICIQRVRDYPYTPFKNERNGYFEKCFR
jgi:hypothetical protein